MMLYTGIQPQNILGSGEVLSLFLPYMGMAPILFNGAEPFEHIDDTLWQKATCEISWKLAQLFQKRRLKIRQFH